MKKKAKYPDNGIWLAVALLVILLLLTGALLADMLGKSAATRDTIALTPEESQKTAYQLLYRPAEAAPAGQTQDQNTQWESSTQVDLFRASYVNDNGTVTVQSAQGDKVIAPGTTNVYAFSVRNTGNTALTYALSLDGLFTQTGAEVPLQFRLRRGNAWLAGSETAWCTLAELNACTDSSTLNPEKINEYLLEWQWPFAGRDDVDTSLAQLSLEAGTDFTLTITTTAEAAADAPAVNGDGDRLYVPVVSTREIALLALDLCALAGLLLLLWRRRVYVCGFVPAVGSTLGCGYKKDTVRPDGRFTFGRLFAGKHRFALGDSRLPWQLRRDRDVEGLRFGEDGVQLMGRNVRAVELYLTWEQGALQIDTSRWAAVDRRNNVYTPAGTQPPARDGSNVTPGGLRVDKRKKYTFPLQEKAMG